MFDKILIANRGEIACRVAATARRMGIRSVAVYSAADAQAKHVGACDETVLIGPAAAKDSYLRGDKIIAAALATGAQAIHPGYGFLSENADFARACTDAGLVFIGPSAAAIEAMGSKSAAKTLMERAGVPLVPGYHGADQNPALLQQAAERIGYPVLLKASAGGGGKGMRVIEAGDDFEAALHSCQREARNSFGNDQVLVEKYLIQPRHIEIQIFADSHGECVYLFERDCSVQRRHQKVLEEAPAPGLSAARRDAMGRAAVAAARSVGYVGAGTVEFIVHQDGAFYFMEMNTRLQVEHPVTEMITGLDLVEWQLHVAAGEALPLRQEQLTLSGHAIEARIYAENPEQGFLPSIGILQYLHTPPAATFQVAAHDHEQGRATVRIDSGVREGDTISPFYDPMIAKLIVWGHDRDAALTTMATALAQYRIIGLATNIAFLQRLIDSHAFASAQLDTGLIERHHDILFPPPSAAPRAHLMLAVAALLGQERVTSNDPWAQTNGWRLNRRLLRQLPFSDDQGERLLTLEYGASDCWRVQLDDATDDLQIDRQQGTTWSLTWADGKLRGEVVRSEEVFHVFHGGMHSVLRWHDPLAHAAHSEQHVGGLSAPMPGKLVAVMIAAGQVVTKGMPLLIMEAMKMEHTIVAPADGVIDAVLYQLGDQVSEGAQLLAFTPA